MQPQESVLVVIPTYNERENLPQLVPQIAALGIPGLRMLVVDDNSPDGTGAVADELSRRYPLDVLHRPRKEGLGVAYRDAFSRLLRGSAVSQPAYVIHMDADLSHDPAEIPRMLEAVRDADLVVGSRYVAGGSIKNWNAVRRLLSRAANWYVRWVLGLPYRDATGGFRCYRWRAFSVMDFASAGASGYSFLIETLYGAHRRGFLIREVPITFTERRRGASKLNVPRYVLEVCWRVLRLRLSRERQL